MFNAIPGLFNEMNILFNGRHALLGEVPPFVQQTEFCLAKVILLFNERNILFNEWDILFNERILLFNECYFV